MSIFTRLKRLTLINNNCKHLRLRNSPVQNNFPITSICCHLSQFTRCFSGTTKDFVPFEALFRDRRSQANRSVVVQVNSEHSFHELHAYCSQFGKVVGIYHYKLLNGQQHFMLVELEKEENANDLMKNCNFSKQLDTIPVQSPFLWFRSAKDMKNTANVKNILKSVSKSNPNISLSCTNGLQVISDNDIMDKLLKSKTLNEQILNLYMDTKLNDLGTRLRFMVAKQIESALVSLYPQVSVRPFGSSVNGFGKMGCDLDLLLKITTEIDEKEPSSRLVFHTKRSTVTGRVQQQKYMEIIGDIIQLFMPGCSQIRRILQARIPIIKYNQDYASLECDLSMNSMSGVYMSELLYTFGCLDERVKPLVFAIRKWAQSIGITNPSPGKWITNFPLTLMVIFYLQNACNGPILPSFNTLKQNAEKHDARLTDDYVDCTFLRDIRKLNFRCVNNDSLEDLFVQFFSYYSTFNYNESAISINLGKPTSKPDHSSLYIVNPLESTLNVSKNVSSDECERIFVEFRNVLWLLETHRNENDEYYWGLPLLLSQETQMKSSPYKQTKNLDRIISVKDLFIQDDITNSKRDMNIMDLKNELEDMRNDNEESKVVFKNEEVKNHINDIRKLNDSHMKKRQKALLDSFLGNNSRIWIRRKSKR